MSKQILRGRALVDGEFRDDQILICEGGRFTFVGPQREEVPDHVFETGCLVPGFLDIHVHGAHGADVMDGTSAGLETIAQALASYGVTGFLATTLTGDLDHLEHVLQTCVVFSKNAAVGARLLGVHLEGPWINARYKGAQNEAHVVRPLLRDAKRLVEAGQGLLKLVTLAPEHPEAADVIAYLHEQGVCVSVGHSDATFADVTEAMEHGLGHVTHCCNAMRGLHHREPGVVGAAMYHEALTAELIADGVHVHPAVMNILYKVKRREHLVLVSDGMRAVGMQDGAYDLGGLQVQLVNGEARLEDGTLAGSTLTLDRAVRNMVTLGRVPLADAVIMASSTPAAVLGLTDRKGQLASGYDADFVWLDDDHQVRATYIAGVRQSR
ncbi:N-acetylglucosamine-6-phosphate deacetylase [Tumebacillus permanentifrigoris]|uniref:N-acetylglucosamine-6-phosphate deacetylase n=1 Tax=Tumebacillus permanentifrigoris TaxID=378543 RepID=A0A316DGD5_9BACL|nr:N-acetylglucosamine-6-phosphate deacetylase [Tumebacillus permanentifrigoris]PWK15633.1 N-acetylglucosamine 6-phosphate deacetylase [Tumebacillus permanentifrigoris]